MKCRFISLCLGWKPVKNFSTDSIHIQVSAYIFTAHSCCVVFAAVPGIRSSRKEIYESHSIFVVSPQGLGNYACFKQSKVELLFLWCACSHQLRWNGVCFARDPLSLYSVQCWWQSQVTCTGTWLPQDGKHHKVPAVGKKNLPWIFYRRKCFFLQTWPDSSYPAAKHQRVAPVLK